jgi:hypothetical protein
VEHSVDRVAQGCIYFKHSSFPLQVIIPPVSYSHLQLATCEVCGRAEQPAHYCNLGSHCGTSLLTVCLAEPRIRMTA